MLKFRLLLLSIYVRLWWLSHFNQRFRQRVEGKDFSFSLGLINSPVERRFSLSQGRVTSQSNSQSAADVSIHFCSGEYGYRMLMMGGRKPLKFADGMNKQHIVVRGTVDYLFWLMDLGRYLPLQKRSRFAGVWNALLLACRRFIPG